MVEEEKKKQYFSRIHVFSCGKECFKDEHSRIGGPGFSRIVYCDDDGSRTGRPAKSRGKSNYVSTTKYTLATFFPKSLFEQFRRVANIYFLICAVLSFTPLSPYSAISNAVPLAAVMSTTMSKEAVEDWKRKKQDIKVNKRMVQVHCGEGRFDRRQWMNLKAGDIVKVERDAFFPADLILISSSYDEAICYVETTNLDGETNLKVKQAVDATSNLQDDSKFRDFRGVVRCEDPNANLYSFIGCLDLGEQQHPLTLKQLLLRDSKLRNTEYIYGMVIFTGHETKVIQNSTDPPSKRSKIERRMDKIVYLLFLVLVLMSVTVSTFFGVETSEDEDDGRMKRWYLRPDRTTIYYSPNKAAVAAILRFLTSLMLYSYLIPISLYVSIEIVKILQSIFINQDQGMYYEEANKPARARTSNLNDELGQVDTILSDKTGTLTCNLMEFLKFSVAGTSYGQGLTEVEKAIARRRKMRLPERVAGEEDGDGMKTTGGKPSIRGFNFVDQRIMNGSWVSEPHPDTIQMFLRLLAICHTAIPEIDRENGRRSYEAESPDEAAFVIAARELGFEFYQRTQTSISLHELDSVSGSKLERNYKLLSVIEFSSARRRMSVIVRDMEGKLLLLCKGADSVMFARLANNGRTFEEQTKRHITEYADAGLRIMVLAYRILEEEEYAQFHQEFCDAKNSVSESREDMIEEVAERIERELVLLGATAVEDKLQNGVPECIDKLAKAGIKIWVLTGDKIETAINIGFACGLLRQGMEQIIISSETQENKALEKMKDKVAAARVFLLLLPPPLLLLLLFHLFLILSFSISVLLSFICSLSSESTEPLALIIDGGSLTHALQDDVKDMFLELATGCASVICCRSSPKQKALVTRMLKRRRRRRTTMAVGDGANDVGMLQEADIGVGISGVEGMQAVMASDIAVAQFQHLERLLLVHGHWCYGRISAMICYFFYKNIAFGFTLFFYDAYTSFSGQPAYNDWFLSLYNVFFTSLPVIALGVLDQDVSARICLKFPLLYQEGVQNLMFSWRRILGWAFSGVLTATFIFFFCITATEHQASRNNGQVVGLEILGAMMYTCTVCVVNCQMALSVNYFTYLQHLLIWGGIAFWYIFLLAYGSMNPNISTSAFRVFIEACAPAPFYWLITLLVSASSLLPFFVYHAIQIRVFPMHHQVMQLMRGENQTEDLEYSQIVRQRSVRPTTVGYSARFEAKSNHYTSSPSNR